MRFLILFCVGAVARDTRNSLSRSAATCEEGAVSDDFERVDRSLLHQRHRVFAGHGSEQEQPVQFDRAYIDHAEDIEDEDEAPPSDATPAATPVATPVKGPAETVAPAPAAPAPATEGTDATVMPAGPPTEAPAPAGPAPATEGTDATATPTEAPATAAPAPAAGESPASTDIADSAGNGSTAANSSEPPESVVTRPPNTTETTTTVTTTTLGHTVPLCGTGKAKHGMSVFYAQAPEGTPCVFGVDALDEGSHCIMDDSKYGPFGWCWTNVNRDTFGICNSTCPLVGPMKVIGKKIDDLRRALLPTQDGANTAAVPTVPAEAPAQE